MNGSVNVEVAVISMYSRHSFVDASLEEHSAQLYEEVTCCRFSYGYSPRHKSSVYKVAIDGTKKSVVNKRMLYTIDACDESTLDLSKI